MKIKDFEKQDFAYRVWRERSHHDYSVRKEKITKRGTKYIYCGTRKYCQPESSPNAMYLEIPYEKRIYPNDYLFANEEEALNFIAVQSLRKELNVRYGLNSERLSADQIKQIYAILTC